VRPARVRQGSLRGLAADALRARLAGAASLPGVTCVRTGWAGWGRRWGEVLAPCSC